MTQRSASRILFVPLLFLWIASGVFASTTFAAEQAASPTLQIDCDFPGGNVIVERIEGSDVFLRQDPRDTPRFWFYWYFRVREAAGQSLTFHFTQGNVLGVRGPAVSTDGGETWSWLGADAMDGASFTYTFPAEADEVRFCLAMPYLESHLREFLGRYRDNPHLRIETHTTSRKGRTVERLRLGDLDGSPNHRVVLACRHHACETMASWALEGVMEVILSDTPEGQWLRENVEFLVFPFMDKDGVEDGDQGKDRAPHDHNRDYLGESIYPEVDALRRFVPAWSEGRLRIALDMHCPYIRGGGDRKGSNERLFFVGGPSEEGWARLEEFSQILEDVQVGPLRYARKHNLPYGENWNTLEQPRSFGRWAALLPGVKIATTIEVPYADVAGTPVTPDSARAFGRDLSRAIRVYLDRLPVEPFVDR
ncbi:MAG: peptidase M14 [Planctomycetaceae bacterium]|nr:MAG: peptidase M14 [Planctomycetaceae bacterium]